MILSIRSARFLPLPLWLCFPLRPLILLWHTARKQECMMPQHRPLPLFLLLLNLHLLRYHLWRLPALQMKYLLPPRLHYRLTLLMPVMPPLLLLRQWLR